MLTYDTIKKLCKNNKITVTGLEKELGFARGSLCKVNTSKPSMEKVQKLADYFNVSVEYLMTGVEGNIIKTCPDCGLSYDSTYAPDVEEHNKEHAAWENAVKKFGELYCNHSENERIKAENRNIRNDLSLPLEERYQAELKVLECLFARSVQSCGYNLNHVPFEQYVSMMLGNKTYIKNLDEALYKKLKKDYGESTGIERGTIYDIPPKTPTTIAAHLDTDDLTEEELQDVANYIEFIKSKRSKIDISHGDDIN